MLLIIHFPWQWLKSQVTASVALYLVCYCSKKARGTPALSRNDIPLISTNPYYSSPRKGGYNHQQLRDNDIFMELLANLRWERA